MMNPFKASNATLATIFIGVIVVIMGVSLAVLYTHNSMEQSRIAKEEIIEKLYPVEPIDLQDYLVQLEEVRVMAHLCNGELDADIALSEAKYCMEYDKKVKRYYQSYVFLTTEQIRLWSEDQMQNELADELFDKIEALSRQQAMIRHEIHHRWRMAELDK